MSNNIDKLHDFRGKPHKLAFQEKRAPYLRGLSHLQSVENRVAIEVLNAQKTHEIVVALCDNIDALNEAIDKVIKSALARQGKTL